MRPLPVGIANLSKTFPSHLKLHTGQQQDSQSSGREAVQYDLATLLDAFRQTTGWRVCSVGHSLAKTAKPHATQGQLAEAAGQAGTVHSGKNPLPPTLEQRMRLVSDLPMDGMLDMTEEIPAVSEKAAWELLEQIDALVQRLQETENAIAAQEAQLACALIHPRFPNQIKLKTYKPILSEVVNAVKNAGYKPHYNIEIKRSVEGDGVFHPDALSFTKLVVENVINLGIAEVTTIQSFDHDCLNYTKMFAKDLKTVMLVEDENTLSWHLDKLDHQPYAYSPDFHLVDSLLVKSCHDKNIKIIPWTVNEVKDIQKMKNLGVDGIISDYPDRVIAEVRK